MSLAFSSAFEAGGYSWNMVLVRLSEMPQHSQPVCFHLCFNTIADCTPEVQMSLLS